MKALQKSPISPDHSLEVKRLIAPHFDPNWHFHPEFQLFIVLEGTGTRFIGDSVHPFRKGDVVFTGPNLPHVWRSDQEYFTHNEGLSTEGIVIYFHEHILGDAFLKTNEAYKLRQLFLHARRGMTFTGATADHVERTLYALLDARDFNRVLLLFQLLNQLANTDEFSLLATSGYTNTLKDADTRRMNDVHAYVMANFRDKITLNEAAAIASMTPTSFSRYFKVHANKTFSEFVSEIRIGHACKLLAEKKIAVSQVSDESGFQTMSNFNRQFRNFTGYNPLEYRRKYAESSLVY
ncbi:AraC family transcriptional regulator [Chryseolinea sp. T2]|uniref:AraC family transcriptional regulator n=1 Tax=Chryseolinea sp. T2 TaxID=3129255 RepID=UPI00307693D3